MIKPYSAIRSPFSKGEVRRAGELVVSGTISQDAPPFQHAMRIIQQWRTLHLYPLNTFQALLRKKLVGSGAKEPLFAQRLKKMSTMLGKLSRIDGGLDSMQDIAGIRIVFQSLDDLRKFESRFRISKSQHKLQKEKNYIDAPKADGYRAIHLIYRCHSRSKNVPTIVDGLMVEMQLRTKLQHYWATAVEAVDMFYGQTLKFGKGEQEWREFFALTSAAFALAEKTALPEPFSALSKEGVLQKLRAAEARLKAVSKLEAIRSLTFYLKPRIKRDTTEKFYLLMLVREPLEEASPLMIRIATFEADQEEEANQIYRDIEKNKSQDVVLVRTTGKQLAKLYSNYFLDVTEFLGTLKKILGATA